MTSTPLVTAVTDDQLLPLIRVFEKFRELNREVPIQCALTFVYIAAHDGCHKQVLEEALGFGTASSSRNVNWLCGINRLGKLGPGLVQRVHDPSNLRRIRVFLTPLGRQFADDIKAELNLI